MAFFSLCAAEVQGSHRHLLQHTAPLPVPGGAGGLLNWEFNNSALDNENSLHVNATYLQNYMTCFFKRTRCWWYNNQTFQGSFLGLGFLCLGCLVYSMTGGQEGERDFALS